MKPSVLVLMFGGMATLSGVASADVGAGLPKLQPATESTTADLAIDQLMKLLWKNKRLLPTRAFEIALQAYEVYQTYRNGQAVEAVSYQVRYVLEMVHDLEGKVVEERQAAMAGLEKQAEALLRTSRVLVRLERDFRRKMCTAGFVRRNGKCVDVRFLPPLS